MKFSAMLMMALAAAALAQAPAKKADASQKVATLNLATAHPRGKMPRGLLCPDPTDHPIGNLTLTVTPPAKTTYGLNEELVYTLRIENAGTAPFSIPWSPNPADLPHERYADKYIMSSFRVAAITECGAASFPETELFGDPAVKKTWLELKPHQYALVTLRTKVIGLKACSATAPTAVKLRFTMAQSAARRGENESCILSFFQGYHANELQISLAPAAPELKKAKGK